MPRFWGHPTNSPRWSDWEEAIDEREFINVNDYDGARSSLVAAEKERAFDQEVLFKATETEKKASEIVRRLRNYDREHTYGKSQPAYETEGKRMEGQHFLGSVEHIKQTKLFNVAKQMPKGAHLHIHFNSCLEARFLIEQARDIKAMYIRSDLPLTTSENWINSRISFSVLTLEEATHIKKVEGNEKAPKSGNIFRGDYGSDRWMSYHEFQSKFVKYEDDSTKSGKSEGTSGAEAWLERKMAFSEEEAHGTHQTGKGIWEKFNYRTQMMKGLFNYESAFRSYTRACILDFVKDNIQYAEIRPNFMATNSLKSDDGSRTLDNTDMMRLIDEELQNTMEDVRARKEKEKNYFGGMKVIYCTPRSFKKPQINDALNECIKLKQKYPKLLCGFDLVGHEEMGNELYHFVPEFLAFRKRCKDFGVNIPFLFHCGETLQVGDKVDGNLFDAILLNAKRIGHGYAVARHPVVMNLLRERGIAIESCPISNEVLGLTPIVASHHLPVLLANDVACTINSDNATFYKSSLSHDFYQVMIGSESMTLLGWKQLALWSLQHSCMDVQELEAVRKEWNRQWEEFCNWIIVEYDSWLELQDQSALESRS